MSTAKQKDLQCDVAICGGGLSGLASSILLSRLGLKIICLEPSPFPHHKVGESFDWSTPSLLKSIGLDPAEIIESGIAMPKEFIKIISNDGKIAQGGPKKWMGEEPWNLQIVTLHADRTELDCRLHDLAIKQGVSFIHEGVRDVEKKDGKIESFVTAGKQKIKAKWFVDASGNAQVLGRNLNVKKRMHGPSKTSIWTTFPTSSLQHGTSLYGNTEDDYLSWFWSIPIRPNVVSLGCILPAERVKKKRKSGYKLDEIYMEELKRYPFIMDDVLPEKNHPYRTCVYAPYAHEKVYGPNWMMIGEAAAMHDALTSNGVTNGLRHAHDVARIIGKSLLQEKSVNAMLKRYNSKVYWMGRLLNYGIEKIVYERHLRFLFGIETVGRLYAKFAFAINSIYTKFPPHTAFRFFIFKILVLIILGLWSFSNLLGKVLYSLVAAFTYLKRSVSLESVKPTN